MNTVELERQRLKSQWVHTKHRSLDELNSMLKTPISREHSLEELIRRPEMTYAKLTSIESLGPSISDPKAAEQVEIQIKYAGYIERQKDEVAKSLRHENTLLPRDFDFSQISGLSNEVVAKLTDARPETLGKASRISGITPAAISLLLVYLKKHSMSFKSEKKTA
jgi:tRNA uridine 5-carboxymethylaminomethyl modification enzyme